MADVIKLRWLPAPSSGLSRRDRQGCDYQAYVPDRLAGRGLRLDARTAADVADAELAIAELNRDVRALANSEAIARLLLRAEAVASSKIEGLEVGGRRLLKAQLARQLDDARTDITAIEVLNNVEAMSWAVDELSDQSRISVSHLLAMHERLLAGTRLEPHGGRLREVQNWIGGSDHNPCSAAFVPPPPDLVEKLLDDLCEFCNDDAIPAVAQAAIAHAQFETIHPFVDGNGRAGRTLIHVILRRRGVAPTFVPPISLVLATRAADYAEGLTRTRYVGPSDGADAAEGLDDWVSFFAGACRRAVADAHQYEQRVAELKQRWRIRLGRVRRGSAADLLLDALPGAPVLTVPAAASLIGRSVQATNEAVARLADGGVLSQITIGRRNRAFEAGELIDAFTALERQLASPDADTRTSPPVRRVPHRRAP
jgi:Fic family protein